MSSIVEKVRPIIEPIVEQFDCYLVDIEYVKEGPSWFLRIFADKEDGGIDLDDCALISEAVSSQLDAIQPDPFPAAYYLEVSSPGAERPLKNEQAIIDVIGEYVHFDYYVPQYGEKSHEGTLIEVNRDNYIIETRIKSAIKQLEIPKTAVSKARLAIKF